MKKHKKDITALSPVTIRSYEHLGNTIRRIRKLQNLSQSDLAKQSGLTQTTISNIERAKSSAEIETIILIFAALNLDIVVTPRSKIRADSPTQLEGLF